jgi:putative NADPH-quinone reductase/NAD-dependent dihydropyrimidine dehydrogenase PreA subunit
MKILVTYFSPTSNTKKIANKIVKAFTESGAQVDEKDITSFSDRSGPMELSTYDAVVFGFPIYVNRAPAIMRQWLKSLDGGGKKCSTFFTYGGINSHPAHRSTRSILEGQNFELVSSADFPGAHTFNRAGWEAMSGRPDDSDFNIAKEYAQKTIMRFSGEDEGRPGEFPEGAGDDKTLDQMEIGMKTMIPQFPSRMGEDCSMCLDCENLCPSDAMDAKTGEADKEKCILCLRCVDICPDEILKFSDLAPLFKSVLERVKQTKEGLLEKKSKLYF